MDSAVEIDLCQFPSAPPPTEAPNFADPPTWESAFLGTTAAMMAWSTAFLAGRLWINRRRLQAADGE
jgi:hypothetical protein